MRGLVQHKHLPIRLDTALLCLTIIVAPQLFAGAFPWAVVAIAGLCVACLGAALWERRFEAAVVIDVLFVVMFLAWLWTCLQAIPLPSRIAEALGAGSIESAKRLQGLEWVGAVPLTISVDPGATLRQISVGIGILSCFLAARLGSPSNLKALAPAAVTSAVLVGFVGFAHQAAGATTVFGVYTPRFTATRMLAPVMNSNHLGGLSLLGALIAAGLAADSRERDGRFAWTVASVFCCLVVAWSLSRGAIGALLSGFVLLSVWLKRHKRFAAGGASRAGGGAAIPAAVVVAALLGVVVFAGLRPILQRFETQGLDKFAMAWRGFSLLEGPARWLGVGRGAFSAAFVNHEGSLNRYTHPENLVVQWVTEWGVLLASVLLVALAVALWQRFRRVEEPLSAAVCIAIFALSLQNMVDFSLEMAGIVVVVAALLGALLSTPERAPSPASQKRRGRSSRLGVTLLAVFSVALLAVAPRTLASDTQSIADRLVAAMQADDEAMFVETLQRGLALHPSEPAFALLAGTYGGIKRHLDAGSWLSIAMDEAPGWAAPHAVAARLLFTEGQIDQALIEVRQAEERQAGSGHQVLCEILTGSPEMAILERAAPSEQRRSAYLNRTASFCSGLSRALRRQIDAAILEAEPTHPMAVRREAQHLIALQRADEAVALLDGALETHPGDGTLWVSLVRAHLGAGDSDRAREALERAKQSADTTRALLEAEARIQATLGDAEAMRVTVTRLRGQARGNPSWIARSFLLEGELEASLGNIDEALAAYQAADTASPATNALHRAASLAIRIGRPIHARRLYRTLCMRTPDGPACVKEAQLARESGRAALPPSAGSDNEPSSGPSVPRATPSQP